MGGMGKGMRVKLGGEDEGYVMVRWKGKEDDMRKGKKVGGEIGKLVGVKGV